jgi:hypothetical protein
LSLRDRSAPELDASGLFAAKQKGSWKGTTPPKLFHPHSTEYEIGEHP